MVYLKIISEVAFSIYINKLDVFSILISTLYEC